MESSLEKHYTIEEFVEQLKKDSSVLSQNKHDIGYVLKNNILSVSYKSSEGKKKKTIVCSYFPLIEFFLSGLGVKRSKIRTTINALREKENEFLNDENYIDTFSVYYRKPQRLPVKEMQIIDRIEISPDNTEKICEVLSRISKEWKYFKKSSK